MDKPSNTQAAQDAAEKRVDQFRRALGPFVVAAETTRMPMIFTDATVGRHPVVFANNSYLALTGFTRGAVLGQHIAHLLGKVIDRNTRSSIENALDTGIDGTWETNCRRVDGSEYLATVFMSPVRDDEGAIRQHFLSFVEVGGEVDRLLEQRNAFRSLYEQAPGFIATLEGPEHRFTFANAAYRRLVGRDELIGRTVLEALPEMTDQGFLELLDAVFQTGDAFVGTSMPIRFRAAVGDGDTLHYINFVYQPVRDAQDRITGLFCEGYDVTAERLAADKLAVLQSEVAHLSRVNAMGMMAATLAHELNQPLTAVANYAAGGLRLIDPAAPHAGLLNDALLAIDEAAHRAGDIIRNVRELTQRGETPKGDFDLKAAIVECVRLVRAGGCFDVTIVDLVPQDLTMVGNRIQIQQVVVNLLRNACDAAERSADPRVTITAVIDGEKIVVSVTDTGEGLSVEAAASVFTWTDSSKSGGMGLGLSISRTIVEEHRGRIWLERSDRTGSQFCFSVPIGYVRQDDTR